MIDFGESDLNYKDFDERFFKEVQNIDVNVDC